MDDALQGLDLSFCCISPNLTLRVLHLSSVVAGEKSLFQGILRNLCQWFSIFLMPQPLNTVPHVVVTPNIIFVATL